MQGVGCDTRAGSLYMCSGILVKESLNKRKHVQHRYCCMQRRKGVYRILSINFTVIMPITETVHVSAWRSLISTHNDRMKELEDACNMRTSLLLGRYRAM